MAKYYKIEWNSTAKDNKMQFYPMLVRADSPLQAARRAAAAIGTSRKMFSFYSGVAGWSRKGYANNNYWFLPKEINDKKTLSIIEANFDRLAKGKDCVLLNSTPEKAEAREIVNNI